MFPLNQTYRFSVIENRVTSLSAGQNYGAFIQLERWLATEWFVASGFSNAEEYVNF